MSAKKPLQLANSFSELVEDNELRRDIQSTNWQYVRSLLSIKETIQDIDTQLHDLLLEFGVAVVNDESPDRMEVIRARKLQENLHTLHIRCIQLREQMRAAMRERTAALLPPGTIETVPEDVLCAFFAQLERAIDM